MEKEYLYVILSGILSGFLVFGGQIFFNLGLSLIELSLLTEIIIVLTLLPPIIFNSKLRPRKGLNLLMVFYGFGTALTVFSQYGALILGVPVAIVVLLLYTQPLWTLLVGKFILKEKLTKIRIIAGILVILGMIILVNPFQTQDIGNWSGILVALIGGIALSSWVILGSVISKKKSPPITTKFLNAFISSIFIVLFYPLLLLFTDKSSIIGFSLDFSLPIWFYLIIFTIIFQIVNHILYYKGTRKVPTIDAGIILLLEPVVGALLASLFLNQLLTGNILIGGSLILIANYLVIKN